ncbi:MAG: protease inhibitor I42 family protein [Chloroflexota bacterium]|nr:protease inhibitor I42 family protein [Dehalococcoidales bacterium]
MWRLLAALGVLVTALLVLAGCSTAAAGKLAVEVPCDEFTKSAPPVTVQKDLTVSQGQSFTVTLCANPTTGYLWEEAKISDGSVLKEANREFVAPTAAAVGAAGQETWTFEALQKGTATASMDYSRPWQGGEKGTWKFVLDVTVK